VSLQNGETLFYIAYPLLEVQLQHAGFLTAHTACVSFDGKAALLLGKTGSGKTSTAIVLCTEYGAKLIGNDLSVLGLKEGVATVLRGTKYFFLRQESVRQNLPALLHFFQDEGKDSWTYKRSIEPEEIGVEVGDDSIPIAGAYLIHVDNNQLGLHVANADGLVTRLYLNEIFSTYIRMTCSTVLTGNKFEFEGYLPSFDCEEYFWHRVKLMNVLLKDVGVTYVSGPLRDVSAWIHQDVHAQGQL
jgi:hypothetical protein